MLEIGLIMALTSAVVEVVKRLLKKWLTDENVAVILPFLVIGIAAALNLGNAALFDPTIPWRDAVKAGIIEGASVAGIYSLVKNITEKYAA